MSTGIIATATQITDDRTFYLSAIDIRLARDSIKVLKSITLYKNDEPLKEVEKTIRAGESHREEFREPFALHPSDNIRMSAKCNTPWRKGICVAIEVIFIDNRCVRDEGGVRLYRTKKRNIEVVVTTHQQSLPAIATQILQSGIGKTSLIFKVFGVRLVKISKDIRGKFDIEQEFTSPTNGRFVVHDSLGFEAGDEDHINIVRKFVAGRKAMPKIEDQLHAVWLCLEVPYAGGRLLETGVERFLQRRSEILGDIPFMVVFTKVDLLDGQLELDQPKNETLEDFRSRYVEKHIIKPIHNAAGNDVACVIVSVIDGYATSVLSLLEVTKDNMEKYHVDEGPCFASFIAQRISIKGKIELSIAVGKKRYWNTLLKSAVLRGQALKECLQVIREDIITIWNFNDPDQCLMDDKIVEALLRTDNLGDAADVHTLASFSSLLESSFETVKNVLGSGDVTSAILGDVAKMAISIPEKTYQDYPHAKDAKILTAYIVDLICVMQIIFLSISGDRVTLDAVAFALQVYEEPRRIVHRRVDEFAAKSSVLPGGHDYVLENLEELIRQYSIPDLEIERLSSAIMLNARRCR